MLIVKWQESQSWLNSKVSWINGPILAVLAGVFLQGCGWSTAFDNSDPCSSTWDCIMQPITCGSTIYYNGYKYVDDSTITVVTYDKKKQKYEWAKYDEADCKIEN